LNPNDVNSGAPRQEAPEEFFESFKSGGPECGRNCPPHPLSRMTDFQRLSVNKKATHAVGWMVIRKPDNLVSTTLIQSLGGSYDT